jgi:hypothetical protein
MHPVIPDPENVRIVDALKTLARSEAWKNNMKTVAFAASGLGGLLILGAIALTIYDNGTAIAGQRLAGAGASFGRAISDALANAKVQVGGDLHVAPGETLLLEKGAQITVRQDKPLVVTGELTATIPHPTEEQLGLAAHPPSNAKVVTNYTVFKAVQMSPGEVVTGWKFDESSQERPSFQYCYFSQTLDESAQATIQIGKDGVFKPPAHSPKGFNAVSAFQNCTWR